MEKYDNAVREIEDQFNKLEEKFEERKPQLTDEAQKKGRELLDKTKSALRATKAKVEDALKDVQESESVNNFISIVRDRVQETLDYTKNKIDGLEKKPECNCEEKCECDECACGENCDCGDECTCGPDCDCKPDCSCKKDCNCNKNETVEKVKKELISAAKTVKAKADEFMAKPETKAAINKAKKTTIKVAEKGLAGLKKLLKADELNNN